MGRKNRKMKSGSCKVIGKGKKRRCLCKGRNGKVKFSKLSKC